MPADLEENWDTSVLNDVVDEIENYNVKTGPYIRVEANVLFSINDAIFAKSLLIKQKEALYDDLLFSVKKFLIDEKYGIENKKTIEQLLEIAKDIGKNRIIIIFQLIFGLTILFYHF